MSAVMIIAFAIVGDTHQRLGVGLAAATKAAISFAIISALSSFLNSLFAILMFFNYHKGMFRRLFFPK